MKKLIILTMFFFLTEVQVNAGSFTFSQDNSGKISKEGSIETGDQGYISDEVLFHRIVETLESVGVRGKVLKDNPSITNWTASKIDCFSDYDKIDCSIRDKKINLSQKVLENLMKVMEDFGGLSISAERYYTTIFAKITCQRNEVKEMGYVLYSCKIKY